MRNSSLRASPSAESKTVTINGNAFRVVSESGATIPTSVKRKAHRMIPKPLDGEPVRSGTLYLPILPPSVNSMFFNRTSGRGRGKTLAYRNWRAAADFELRQQDSWHVPGQVRIEIRSGGASDLDNRNKAMLDALVGAGRIVDDSPKYVIECRAIHDPDIRGTLIKIEAA